MKLDITEKEFGTLVGVLTYAREKFYDRLQEEEKRFKFEGRSEKRISDLEQEISDIDRLYASKFKPILDTDNLKYLEGEKFILATEATKMWGLSDSTIRRALHDGRFEKDECKKVGRDWQITINAMKRLYGEPKKE